MIFANLKRNLRGNPMKRLLALAIVAIFVIAAFAFEARAWRRDYRMHQRKHYQSYTIKNPNRFKGCQETCQKKYGVDGAKCKRMDTADKKTCRQNNRSCNANCWNEYH